MLKKSARLLQATHRPRSTLYERFGFEVSDEAEVIGVRNWFMTRKVVAPG